MKRPERQARRRVISYDDITVMRIASPNNSCPIKIQTSHHPKGCLRFYDDAISKDNADAVIIANSLASEKEKEEVVIYYTDAPLLGKIRICGNYDNALYTLHKVLTKYFILAFFFVNILSSIHH